MKRVIVLAAVLCVASFPADAQRSVSERAKIIYAVMDLRVAVLRQCAKLDPANKAKFEVEIQRYRQDTKPLFEKVQKIILAEVPSAEAQSNLSVVEKWSAGESKRNLDFDTARREQFMQKCDYAINPEGRKKYGATAARDASIVGLPQAEYPDDVKAINAWKP